MIDIPRMMFSATHKSSGKTVVSTGVAAAMRQRGTSLAAFKKGPDYIDPMWLAAASGGPCYNLDFNTMSPAEIRALFQAKAAGAPMSLVEGNKGLFDGLSLDGSDSNAALAKLLDLPVVLVVDCSGMTRGIAPLLLGHKAFDLELRIAGVILNKVGGARHEAKLRAAVANYTDIEVLGAVSKSAEMEIVERHLGLTTPAESVEREEMIEGFGRALAQSVDLDRLAAIARSASPMSPEAPAAISLPDATGLRVGVARDAAFGFYYEDDLETFRAAGAELVMIDMIRDAGLPPIDALFIGGGFPEARMAELSANESMRRDVRAALESGLPCYAECGGLMYLCRTLSWRGETHPMAGLIEGDAVMHARPQGRGYVAFENTAAHPWGEPGVKIKAHEFHYASIENLSDGIEFSRTMSRGHGVDGQRDGIVFNNTLAGFCHLRSCGAQAWVPRFLDFILGCQEAEEKNKPRRLSGAA